VIDSGGLSKALIVGVSRHDLMEKYEERIRESFEFQILEKMRTFRSNQNQSDGLCKYFLLAEFYSNSKSECFDSHSGKEIFFGKKFRSGSKESSTICEQSNHIQ
jgi:hypothetical protein